MLGIHIENQNAAILHLNRDSFSHGSHTLFCRRGPGLPGLSPVERPDREMDWIGRLRNPFHMAQDNRSSFAALKQIGPAGACRHYLLRPQLDLDSGREQGVAGLDGRQTGKGKS